MLEVATVNPISTDYTDIMEEYHLFDEIFLDFSVLFAYRWRITKDSNEDITLKYDKVPYSVDRFCVVSTIEISPLYIKILWLSSSAFAYIENNKRNMDIIKEWQTEASN